MMKNDFNYNQDINFRILKVISQCKDTQIYSNIMSDIFKNGPTKSSIYIQSMNILPMLSESELKNNFIKNINKIISYIKNITNNPNHEFYRILSCIYGAFLGDAMGAFCENDKPSKYNGNKIFNYDITVIGGVKGQVTDDSEMALSLAYAIMDNPNRDYLNTDYIYFYYGAWFRTNPLDYGHTTKNALKNFDFNEYNPNLNQFQKLEGTIIQKNYNSLSNGFLMRKSPFIVWYYYRFYNEISYVFNKNDIDSFYLLYKKIRDLSYLDNKITNPNYQTNVASGFYCLMALMAIYGFNSQNIIEKIYNLCKSNYFINPKIEDDEKIVSQHIINYINLFKSPKFDIDKEFGDLNSSESVYINMGYYLHALKLTLYFLCKFEGFGGTPEFRGYKSIMNKICELGGDTDTNCCIVGAVIGPLIGLSGFQDYFIQMINVIPPHRAIYSVALAVLFVIYLKKSTYDNNLVLNDKYFLQQILTMLYGDIDLNG